MGQRKKQSLNFTCSDCGKVEPTSGVLFQSNVFFPNAGARDAPMPPDGWEHKDGGYRCTDCKEKT